VWDQGGAADDGAICRTDFGVDEDEDGGGDRRERFREVAPFASHSRKTFISNAMKCKAGSNGRRSRSCRCHQRPNTILIDFKSNFKNYPFKYSSVRTQKSGDISTRRHFRLKIGLRRPNL